MSHLAIARHAAAGPAATSRARRRHVRARPRSAAALFTLRQAGVRDCDTTAVPATVRRRFERQVARRSVMASSHSPRALDPNSRKFEVILS